LSLGPAGRFGFTSSLLSIAGVHHQIPAYKRERGGVAAFRFENDLADTSATDKSNATWGRGQGGSNFGFAKPPGFVSL